MGRDVSGQTGTGRPAVPLSRDKDIFLVPVSLCAGTRDGVNVPGQTPLSRYVPGQNHYLLCTRSSTFFMYVVVTRPSCHISLYSCLHLGPPSFNVSTY